MDGVRGACSPGRIPGPAEGVKEGQAPKPSGDREVNDVLGGSSRLMSRLGFEGSSRTVNEGGSRLAEEAARRSRSGGELCGRAVLEAACAGVESRSAAASGLAEVADAAARSDAALDRTLSDWVSLAQEQGARFRPRRSVAAMAGQFARAKQAGSHGTSRDWARLQAGLDRALIGPNAAGRDELEAAVARTVAAHPAFDGLDASGRARMAAGFVTMLDNERTIAAVRRFEPGRDEALMARLHDTVGPDFRGGTPAERTALARDVRNWAREETARLEGMGLRPRDPLVHHKREDIRMAALYVLEALDRGLDAAVPAGPVQDRWIRYLERHPGDFVGAVEHVRPQMSARWTARFRSALAPFGSVQEWVATSAGRGGGDPAGLPHSQ